MTRLGTDFIIKAKLYKNIKLTVENNKTILYQCFL